MTATVEKAYAEALKRHGYPPTERKEGDSAIGSIVQARITNFSIPPAHARDILIVVGYYQDGTALFCTRTEKCLLVYRDYYKDLFRVTLT